MNNNKNCEHCQAQQQQQQQYQHHPQPQTMNKKLASKTSDSGKPMRYPSTRVSTQNQLCQYPIHTQQLQLQQQQQQRSSSVGSTGSSICDSISSHTGSVLSPTEPNVSHQYLQPPPPLPPPSPSSSSSQQSLLAHTTQLTMSKTSGSGSANAPSVGIMPTHASALSATLTGDIETATRTTPAVTQNVLPPGASTLPSQASTPLVSGLGAAAMAANLAESFSLLHQQAHHFRDILYAAHLLGRGYYQPAGPLITTPHPLPPVNGGHPLAPLPPPPPPSNVSIPPTASDNKTKCPSATASSQDSEHIQLQQAGSQNTSNSTESANIENDVVVTGGDLTPFRYSAQSIANGAAANAAAAHQHQQQQLHQQAAAAAAAAAAAVAAHPNSPYPRSMHAQMHYSPPYPANYYSPYPGEPLCYSSPAYQPYFSSKVYQSAPPPHPPPTAYRHYAYYQPGHPPPPADLYEQVPVPATPNGGQQGGSMPIQGAPPPSQLPGTQLVPASQHLDHYPGPPTYYTSYNPAGTAAGQCYTRSLQGPYMEYAPAQCPCPMQQSCPKNVHTGPHIGSNSSGSNTSSNNSSAATNGNNNNNNNNMAINHNNSVIAAIQQHSRNISSSSAQNNSVSSSNNNNNNNNNNSSNSKMQASNNGMLNTNGINSNMLTTSRGPVKKCNKISVSDDEEAMRGIKRNLDLLSTTVKTEMKSEDFDNKSQYEESVVQPLTPLGNYTPKEHKYSHVEIISKDPKTPIPIFEDVEEAIDKLQDEKMSTRSILPAHLLNEDAIEEYDLTTTTPPLINGNYSGNNSNGSQVSGTAVVRRARIGKTMAREMVYAAANTISPSNVRHLGASSIPLLNNEMVTKRPALPPPPPPSQVLKNSCSAPNRPPMMTNILPKTNVTVPVAIPLVLKAEIKAEKIKLEDEVLDKVLRQQTMAITQQPLPTALLPQMHINQEKIKAEPITLNEVLHESKVKLESDAEMEVVPAEKKVEEDIDIGKDMTVKKCKGRMRLLPSWQQPLLHCDVDLCNASDDEILDLCHSPLRPAPVCNGKRIKTLDYSKLQCKKSPPNSYKNLIKQTEPKTYLCLSRKIDKKSRYGRLQTKSSRGNNSSSIVRRRELILTDQQRQRLRVRKKKLAAIKKQKREAREIKKMEFQQKRKEHKLDIGAAVLPTTPSPPEIIKIEPEAVIVDLIEEEDEQEQEQVNVNGIQNERCIASAGEDNLPTSQPLFERECNETVVKSPRTTSKASPKHLKSMKKPAIPQHIKETIDAVARGYFSEPETHGSILSFSSSSSPKHPMHFPVIADKLDFKDNDLTFTKKQKQKMNTEKRSKSETKKPIKIPPTTSAADAKTVGLYAKVKKADTLVMKFATTTINETLTGSTTSTHLQGAQLNENQKNNYSNQADGEGLSTHKSKRKKCKKDKDKSKSKKSKSSRKDEKISKMKPESTTKASTNEIETVITMPSTEHLSPTINEPNNNELSVDGLPAAQIEITEIDDDSKEPEVSERACIEVTKNAADAMLQISEQQQTAQHSYGLTMNPVFLHPPLPRIVCNSQYHQQHSAKRNRSRTKFGSRKRQKLKHSTVSFELDETLPPATRVDVVPKWNNGWTWEGKPFQGAVFLNSDDPLVLRTCYAAMRHVEGDIIRTRDCVLLKANEDNELPYVAKVAHLWENPEDGEMMMSLLWYYRPEHTEQGRQPNDSPDEVYASRHRDHNSVACIEDKCYVLTFSEYCRYRRRIRASDEDIEDVNIVPKRLNYLNTRTVPDNTNPELIMFCRRAYEFRTKRLLKMPNKQDYYVVKA